MTLTRITSFEEEHTVLKDLLWVVLCESSWSSLLRLRTASRWLGQLASDVLRQRGVLCHHHPDSPFYSGVLYSLGSDFGTKPWSHARVASRCRVSTSEGRQTSEVTTGSWLFDSRVDEHTLRPQFNHDLAVFFSQEGGRIFNHSGVGTWFELDFGPLLRVQPTGYALRHNSSQKRALRNFKTTASLDRKEWCVLGNHVNDDKLGLQAGSWARWDVGGVAEPYRYFRVTKTGPDAASTSYMHLSGMELHGRIFLR